MYGRIAFGTCLQTMTPLGRLDRYKRPRRGRARASASKREAIYVYRYVYIYIYICIIDVIHIYTYVYIYIERERDVKGQSPEDGHFQHSHKERTWVRGTGSGFLRKPTGANRRKRFSTNTYSELVLFLQKSPKVFGNLREFTGECNLGILYSGSLLVTGSWIACESAGLDAVQSSWLEFRQAIYAPVALPRVCSPGPGECVMIHYRKHEGPLPTGVCGEKKSSLEEKTAGRQLSGAGGWEFRR